MLPPEVFLRIHRSYIVSIQKIEAITAETIEIAKRELSIGRSYKRAVFKALNYFDTHRAHSTRESTKTP
jgi:DNA-binding LytR/AlgR family response regulator